MTFGTEEIPVEPREVVAGPLSLRIDGGKIRDIRWYGTELVRSIDCPVRDGHWGTCPVVLLSEDFDDLGEGWQYARRFELAGGALIGRLWAAIKAPCELEVGVEFEATADFSTCRAGFTVLHPIPGVVGEPVLVTHSDGGLEETSFPDTISAGQPVFDIAGLAYSVDGVSVDIRFAGDTFEMEDQRNWTDASFKTYCRPLALPSPFLIAAGTKVHQQVTLRFSGGAESMVSPGHAESLSLSGEQRRFPEQVLAWEKDWSPGEAALSALKTLRPRRILGRISSPSDIEPFTRLLDALRASADMEIILPDSPDECRRSVSDIAKACARFDLRPDNIMAVPEAYLKTIQPEGPWPEGSSPKQAYDLLRDDFANARIGSGVLTNFTEFNRCRNQACRSDYHTFSTTGVFHASDDVSVFQTVETLPYVFRSAEQLRPEEPCRMGLMSIGMRGNSHGDGPLPNARQNRLEMVHADPRQRGLFAAAWMVGAMQATEGTHVESVCLAATGGGMSVVHEPRSWPQPLFDQNDHWRVFPAYHVLKFLMNIQGGARVGVELPPGLYGVAGQVEDGVAVVVANGGATMKRLELPSSAEFVLLDESSFAQAAEHEDWLDIAESEVGDRVHLAPCSVAFMLVT